MNDKKEYIRYQLPDDYAKNEFLKKKRIAIEERISWEKRSKLERIARKKKRAEVFDRFGI